ncbi:hypothetical protein IAT38_005909 [Cryptococcus sp. DSM 104549]
MTSPSSTSFDNHTDTKHSLDSVLPTAGTGSGYPPSTTEIPSTNTAGSPSTDEPIPSIKEKKGKGTSEPPKGHSGAQDIREISKFRFWAVIVGLMVSFFLFALDQLIVATAIPKITEEFNSLTQLSWLASGFFLTLLSFNLLYSQVMNIIPSKHAVIFAVVVFEVGSVVCGVAKSMNVLIFGRALAGLGAAGIFSGSMVIAAELVPLSQRGQYFALFGVCFALASVLGPLVGGAFADHVSWRWCFYINLPFGGIALALIIIFHRAAPPLGRADSYEGYSKKMFGQVLKLDWMGVILSMGWAVCFILATQWGGVTKKWGSASVVVCLVLSGVLPVVFAVYEWYIKDHAYFRIRLLQRRTIGSATLVSFCVFGIYMILVYYLSLTFQAVHHTSATSAGVRLLPLIFVQVAALMISARLIPRIGRFKPVIVCGPIFLAIASGLFYSISYSTPVGNLYGYQVILGVGIGMCLQNVMVAVQHDLRDEPWLISLGTGLVIFMGFCGRIVALSLAGSVFENMIQRNLRSSIPGISPAVVTAVINDASAVWTSVPDELRVPVLEAYTKTLSQVFIIALPFSIIALVAALCMKNDRMVSKEDEQKVAEEAKAAKAEKEAKEGQVEEQGGEEKAVGSRPESTVESVQGYRGEAQRV